MYKMCKMKKWVALTCSAMMLCGSLTACGQASDSGTATTAGESAEGGTESITLKVGVTAQTYGMPGRAAAYFEQRVEENSGGKIQCEVNYAGALGTTAQHYAQLREGTLDIFVTAYDTFNVLADGEDFAICVVPYTFDDMDHFKAWIESDIYTEMVGKVEQSNNIHVLGPVGELCPRGLSTTNVPVTTVADVENLKVRCPETQSMIEVWKAWGANPLILPANEIYTSLDSGICDGQENDVLTTLNSGFAEIQPYYAELDYIQQCAVAVMSASTWDKLSTEQREWVELSCEETLEGFSAEVAEEYTTAKQRMIDEFGVEFTDVDLDSFREATQQAIGDMDGRLFTEGLYDSIRALAAGE